MLSRKRWESWWVRRGACASGVHGLVIAMVMVPGHLWIVIVRALYPKVRRTGERGHIIWAGTCRTGSCSCLAAVSCTDSSSEFFAGRFER
jgi:hypothetical protein